MNKYVVVKNKKSGEVTMRYANTDYHRGMVFNNETCIGGGMFTFDDDKNEMLLWGSSDDFGAPKFSEIKDKIHADEDLQGMTIILGNIVPSIEAHREDITDKFLFDE
jgi:hypothetical protein